MDPAIKRLLWWIVSVVVSIFFILLLFVRSDFSGVVDYISEVWFLPLLIAFGYSLAANYFLSGWQWRASYREMGYNLPILEHVFVKSALYPLRAVVPFRMGDLGRPLYMQRAHDVPYTKSLSVSVLVPGINLGILLFLSIPGFLTAGQNTLAFVCVILLIAGITGFYFALSSIAERKGQSDGTWLGNRLEQLQWLTRFGPEKLMPLLLLGLATIFAQIMEFAMIASAFSVNIPFRICMGYIPIIILAGSIPISVMGLGVRETATVFLLASYGSPEKLLAIGLFFSFMDQVLLALIGGVPLIPFLYACRVADWPLPKEK